MNMSCTRCELCAAAADIYSIRSFVHFSLIFRLSVEPLVIIGIFLLTIAIFNTKSLHFNARILLLCMTFSMLVCNCAILLESLYTLVVSYVLPEESRCDYQVFSPQYCSNIRKGYVFGGMGLAISTLFLAVERTLATLKYKTYEIINHKWLGILLTSIQVFICVGTMLTTKQVVNLPYCAGELMNTEGSKIFGSIIYAANIASFAIFLVLWIINRSRERHLLSVDFRALSTRYQLKENISTTFLMLPVMLIVVLMTTSSQIVYFWKLPHYTHNTVIDSYELQWIPEYAPYAEYQVSLFPVISILMIIFLPVFSLNVRKCFYNISGLYRCLSIPKSRIDSVTAEQARDLYFEKLQGQWTDNGNMQNK